jgi:hypothetical protein
MTYQPTTDLTNSEMGTWRRCRRKWYLGVFRRLQRPGEQFNTAPSIGNRVHAALAAYYSPERQDPLAFLNQKLKEDLAEHADSDHGDIEKEHELAYAMVEGYLEWLAEEGKDQGLRVLESEGARTAPLAPNDLPGVNLLAKLDARVVQEEVDGERWALEHKTVGDLKTPLPTLQIDPQLLTEHLVEFLALREEGREQDRAAGALYNMLRKVKRTARANPPFYGREEVRHNITELRSHWYHVVAIATELQQARQRLDAGESHHSVCYPSPTRDCKWDCPFFHVCPQLDDGSDYEAALAANFVVGDPLKRYNELVPDAPS